MNDTPQRKKSPFRSNRPQQPTRKLNFVSRVRGRFRQAADRFLGADAAWSVTFVVVVVLLVGTQRCGPQLDGFVIGAPAPYDIKAARDIDVVDRALSEERWRQAREEIPNIYTHDSELGAQLVAGVRRTFDQGRQALQQSGETESEQPGDAATRVLGSRIPLEILDALIRHRFDPVLEDEITGALARVMRARIIGNRTLLEQEPEIELVRIPGKSRERLKTYGTFVEVGAARRQLVVPLERSLNLPDEDRARLVAFAASFVDANVHLDREETRARREAVEETVPPVHVHLSRSDVIIKQGEVFTEENLSRLREARSGLTGTLGLREALALLFVASMLAFFLYRYSDFHQRAFKKLKHLHALLVLMLLSMLLLAQAMIWLAGSVVDNLSSPYDDIGAYYFLIPLGAGAILVSLLANGRIATVYSAFGALLYGALLGWDFYLMLWAVLVQLAGVYAIATYRERAALLRAGLAVGAASAVSCLAVEVLRGGQQPLAETMFAAVLAFVGGAVGVSLLISFSLPLLERLFDVLTDIRLLELSNLNTPLLSELAVKAPGTYNHSLVVGTLAEEGAKAIGANSLFCRVAAFYHDVGKIPYAEYYVENQRGVNPHDRLSPSMSALIISSHVKDGIKMAREAGLPEQIIDIIPQHHGTKLMTYFFEKAKSSSDPGLGPVKEEDFRYPGPKPQTREAAIFMISDALEAAARTIDEPTAHRLREMIRKITNSIVLDGQLDSCDLTFADLERMQQAYLKLLVSMYHHRVDYPGFDFGRAKSKTKGQDVPDSKVAKGS